VDRTSDDNTLRLARALHTPDDSDPELARVVAAWPTLPALIRAAMLAMIGAHETVDNG